MFSTAGCRQHACAMLLACCCQRSLLTCSVVLHCVAAYAVEGAYWTSLGKLVSVLPGQFSTLKAAADASGLTSVLTEKGFNDTVFLPTNKVLAQAFNAIRNGMVPLGMLLEGLL